MLNMSTQIPALHPAALPRPAQDVPPPLPGYRLLPVDRGGEQRVELESFIRETFARKHGAAVSAFMPRLLALRGSSNMLSGAIGCRGADEERLYLEQYLDQPIEVALGARLGAPVSRSVITEIGNLATVSCRAARRLVTLLPGYLMERRQEWAVFTATGMIREILESVGAPMLELAAADGNRVAGGRDQWGAYYRTDPRVMAIHVPSGLDISVRRRRGQNN